MLPRRRPTPARARPGRGQTLRYGVKFVFAGMVALFFLNTVILSWHMDRNELYNSIKGRLELLKQSVPWAKAVRDTVTNTPKLASDGSRLADHSDGHAVVRNAFVKEPLPGKLAAPSSIKTQNLEDKHGGLRDAPDVPAHAFRWTENSRSTIFVKLEGNRWTELHDNKPAFYFVERRLVTDEAGRMAELFDESRGFVVMLGEFQAMLKQTEGDAFRHLYDGSWEFYNGKPVEHVGDPSLPPPIHVVGEPKDQTIVVMLAAYRDPLCSNTLFELFQFAEFPGRVSAVVVEQRAPEDPDCLESYCEIARENGVQCHRDRVKVDRVPMDRARGVMPARYRQNLLLDDQEFCLQIDSHSAFEDNWDSLALEDWMLTNNEMAVITAYPNRVDDRHDQRHAPARCSTKFSTDLEVVHGGNSALNVRPGRTPFLIPFFGAGTGFSKCHANLNVPYDPYMSHLFGGEEFNRAIRLFTSGYDMYSPKHNFVYHYYDDDKKPSRGNVPRHREFFNIHGKQRKVLGSQTTARWRSILGLPLTRFNPYVTFEAMSQANLFGLGTRRRIQQYESFSGVHLAKASAVSRCDDIGRLKWQAYPLSEPFYPSGPGCPYRTAREIKANCCTTLAAVAPSTRQVLDLTNDELADKVSTSKMWPRPERPVPFLSPLNNGAYPLPCKPPPPLVPQDGSSSSSSS